MTTVNGTDFLSAERWPLHRLHRLWRLALLLYLLALVVATHIPIPPAKLMPAASDKTLHFIAYFGLGFLVALHPTPSWQRRMLLFLGLLAFGAADELTQPLVRRSAEWADWFADGVGAFAGLLIGSLITRRLFFHILQRRGTRLKSAA